MAESNNFEHKDITSKILNAAFEVHNILRCGFSEKMYERPLIYELKRRGLKVEQQRKFKVDYKEIIAGDYIADIVVDNKVIVELKAVEGIIKLHEAQVLNYLRASKCHIGLIVNFGKTRLEYKRLVLSES